MTKKGINLDSSEKLIKNDVFHNICCIYTLPICEVWLHKNLQLSTNKSLLGLPETDLLVLFIIQTNYVTSFFMFMSA